MFIPLGISAYETNSYNLPPVVLENWMAEAAPDRPDRGVRLVPVPGLRPFVSGLNGIGKGLFRSDGFLDGNMIAVNGAEVRKIRANGSTVTIGAAAGDKYKTQFAVSQFPQLIMRHGGVGWEVKTNSVTRVTLPGGVTEDVIGVGEVNQRHLYLTKSFVFFSEQADAANIGATNFFVTETEPDQNRALFVHGENVFIFGTRTFEIWTPTTSLAVPFVKRGGGTVNKGIAGRDAVAQVDFRIAFVGNDGKIYILNNYQPTRISTHPIEREIESVADKSTISLTSYETGGHAILNVHLPGRGTYSWDAATQLWHRRRALAFADAPFETLAEGFDGATYAQDKNGNVLKVDTGYFLDNTEEIRRVATALVPVEEKPFGLQNIQIMAEAGAGVNTGQGATPQLEFALALDGHVYGNPVYRDLGKIGDYGNKIVYDPNVSLENNVLGVRIALSDPVGTSLYGGKINELRP